MDFIIPILAVPFGIALLYVIVQYNGFISLRNHITEAWSNIDTELRRRYDLIPNLVEVVKGYSAHEQSLFQRITELRAQCAANQGSPASQAGDERQLVGSLRQLFAVVENYPVLQADQHYLQLQKELVNTEDRLQAARRFFNGNVREYNNKRESFPSNLVASLFSLPPKDFFEVDPAIRQTPQVSL